MVIGPSSLAVAPRPGRSGVGGWLAPGLLHALVRDAGGGGVRHYERAQDRPDRGWTRRDLVSPDAVGPGAIVVAGGVLHALVPEPGGVAHHVKAATPRLRAASTGTVPPHTLDPTTWTRRGLALPGRAVSAVASGRGLLAAVAGDDGVAFFRFDGAWRPVGAVPGAGEVAVARGASVVDVGGTLEVRRRGRVLAELGQRGSGPAAVAPDAGGWLVAVPRGDVLETWSVARDGRVARHATVTWGAGQVEAVALAPAASGPWGALHALTAEEGSVFQHRRHRPGAPWLRVHCLRLHDTAPFEVEEHESTKLAQVTGEVDSQPVRGGGRRPTLSRSTSTAGVLGTDLGVRVSHAGHDYLLFGDTHWRGRPWLTTRDSIARIDPAGPVAGLPGITFHGAPLRVRGGGVTMREYDVPLDGFSLGGDLHAFFTSDHFRREQVMGRSVLARRRGPVQVEPRSRRPITFRHLATFSSRHFLNVSVQPVPAASVPGFAGEGEVLLLFGSGPYRAGDLRLAVLDPRDGVVGPRPGPGRRPVLPVRYWAGADAAGSPLWSDREADARPLLHPGAFGEISVRWVPDLGRFLLLACSGPEDPIGPAVTLRTAPQPWGPWSPRRRLLDWVARGMWFDDPYSRFIKALSDGTDPVGDRVFRGQADATGAAYAPYFFDARAEGAHLVLRYCLSTWNPYQVVLMEHRLALPDAAGPDPRPGRPPQGSRSPAQG